MVRGRFLSIDRVRDGSNFHTKQEILDRYSGPDTKVTLVTLLTGNLVLLGGGGIGCQRDGREDVPSQVLNSRYDLLEQVLVRRVEGHSFLPIHAPTTTYES